jgi:hypothetical protein
MINWLSFGLSFFGFFLLGILQPRSTQVFNLSFCIVFVYTFFLGIALPWLETFPCRIQKRMQGVKQRHRPRIGARPYSWKSTTPSKRQPRTVFSWSGIVTAPAQGQWSRHPLVG